MKKQDVRKCVYVRTGPFPHTIEKLFHLQQKRFIHKKTRRNGLLIQPQHIPTSIFQQEVLQPYLTFQEEVKKTERARTSLFFHL